MQKDVGGKKAKGFCGPLFQITFWINNYPKLSLNLGHECTENKHFMESNGKQNSADLVAAHGDMENNMKTR